MSRLRCAAWSQACAGGECRGQCSPGVTRRWASASSPISFVPLLPAEPKARGERAGPAALFGRSGVGRDSRAPQRTPRASVPDPTACAVGSSVVWCPMWSHLAVSWISVPVLTAEHCRQGWRCAHFPVRWFTSRARRAAVGNGARRPDPPAEVPPAGLAGLLGELVVLRRTPQR